MRAVVFREFGSDELVGVADVPTPEPGEQEVRIRVAAATVNRTDINARAGLYGLPIPDSPGYGLGMDVSGEIDAIGAGVDRLSVGDRVVGFCMAPQQRGGQAAFVVLPVEAVAPAPRGTDLVQAATLPLNGLTSLQVLAAVQPASGGTVVVTGAAGGLGMMVLQLAHNAGHRVVAWVRSKDDAAFLTSLGADQVVTEVGELTERSADAVIDTAMLGQETVRLIRDGGAFITVRGIEPELERGIRQVTVWVQNDEEQLAELVSAVESGAVTLPGVTTMPLEEVASAHRVFEAGGVRDRLVLIP